jgi:putative ABC transport system substrate-binding protein
MKRREFIGGLGVGLAWPLTTRAQPQLPVIGFLATATAERPGTKNGDAFRRGLSEGGHIDGETVTIDRRGGTGRYEELPMLAEELVRRPVSVLVTGGVPATLALKALRTPIPSVFYMGGDPIMLGVVDSLSRPGGSVTGVTLLNTELGPKRLELLHQLVPTATSFAVLVNPANGNTEALVRDMTAAARALNLQLHVLRASGESDIDAAFAAVTQLRTGGLVIGADGVFVSQRERLGALASQRKVPAVFQFREFVAAGGLASYGGSLPDAYHQVGLYAARILKGEKPADLPVQQLAKVEMVINLKTAKALGLTIPITVLGRADEVIE